MTIEALDPNVQLVFDSYSEIIRQRLLYIRQLIIEVASETQGVGTLHETLKWGQVSYLTQNPKSGTTIRIDIYRPESQEVAMFVHCQTSLIQTFKQMYSHDFEYEGNRAVIFGELNDKQRHVLKHFIELALTYHSRKG